MFFFRLECLVTQLKESRVVWNVVDAVSDAHFDSSSSLSEGLWNALKYTISNSVAQLLIISDVGLVSDISWAKLWCDFMNANYPGRLIMPMDAHNPYIQIPCGFSSCTRPFGRLLISLDANYISHPESQLYIPLNWLLSHVAQSQDEDLQWMKKVLRKCAY